MINLFPSTHYNVFFSVWGECFLSNIDIFTYNIGFCTNTKWRHQVEPDCTQRGKEVNLNYCSQKFKHTPSSFHYHVNGWFLSQKNYVHTYMRSVESTPSSFHYHVNGCFLSISLCSSPSRVTNSGAFFAPPLQFIFSKVCSFRQQAKCVLLWRWLNWRRCNIKS